MTRRGFTLIELLIVVAIIAILAAIAVPNFLEAQTRGKVAAAKSNLRVLTGGLEMYAVDSGRYPPTRQVVPGDPLGLVSSVQLTVLTTPIAYLGPSAFRDPFGTIRAAAPLPQLNSQSRDNFPTLSSPNSQRSLLYYHYPTMAARLQNADMHIAGAGAISIGPDLQDSLGAYRPFSAPFFIMYFGTTGQQHPLDTEYDPTNGTVSAGDIAGFAGDARRFAVP